jgi:hypothetical protein
MVPTFTMNRSVGRCPAVPPQLRYAYAADFLRGLLTEQPPSVSELPAQVGTRCYCSKTAGAHRPVLRLSG